MSPQEAEAAIEEIRRRVRERHAKTVPDIADFELPSLEPLGRARDVVDAKAAAIGTVNPRPPGLLNDSIQAVKRLIARSLNWLLREQVEYNRAAVGYFDRNIETVVEQNHNILRVAREFSAHRRAVRDEIADLSKDVAAISRHWGQWRPALEDRLDDLHERYRQSLAAAIDETQQRFWADVERLKEEQEKQIHAELRVIRRRAAAEAAPPPASSASPEAAAETAWFDYARFEERFRGNEEHVSRNQEFYLPFFEGARRVVDLGCGRGEFLRLMTERGAEAGGVDLDAAAAAACREKGLAVERGDLFEFLGARPDGGLDGLFCAHVVEHLPPKRLPELMDLAFRKLAPGGVAVFETPNPGCLAIFTGDFYLDPTHVKPVPSAQLDFFLREAGFGRIEVHERCPAPEVFPELRPLDEIEGLRPFRERFFGGLDYAIIARKIGD